MALLQDPILRVKHGSCYLNQSMCDYAQQMGRGITPSPKIPALFGLAPPHPVISNSGQMHVACGDAQVQSVEVN